MRVRSRLRYVHAVMFVAFAALILVPPLLPEPLENEGPLDHPALFAGFVLWSLWFPLVLLSVILAGRAWCGIFCPMGAASEYASKVGLKRRVPGWLRWEGMPIVSFVAVTILGQTVGVRDHPEAAAEIFGGTMLLAVLLGFLYAAGKRAWCRHACPIGLLLGVFSRMGAVQFAPKRPEAGGDRLTVKGACPTMIDLRRKQESRHCIECFRCVSPRAGGGLYLRLRRPGEEIERIRGHNPNAAEIWFLFLGSGVALGGFLWLVLPFYRRLRNAVGTWFIARGELWIGDLGPWWLMAVHPERREVFTWLDFLMISGFMLTVAAALALILALATFAAAVLSGWLGGGGTTRTRFVELGYQFAPLALLSLLLGLAGGLFDAMALAGLPDGALRHGKIGGFVASILWGLYLAERILRGQGVAPRRRPIAMLPGFAGSMVVAGAWWEPFTVTWDFVFTGTGKKGGY